MSATKPQTAKLLEAIENFLHAQIVFAADGGPHNWVPYNKAELHLKETIKQTKKDLADAGI